MNITQAIIILAIIMIINSLYNYSLNRKSASDISTQLSKVTDSKNSISTTPAIKYFGTAIFILPLLGGLWGINYWLKDYNIANDTLNWNKTSGTIISKSIDSKLISNHSTDVISSDTSYYSPNIVYQFKIGDDTYESSNIDYNSHPTYGDKSKAEMILKKFPEPGEPTDVYVKHDVSKSVLKPGTQNMSYFGILASLPFFIAGFAGIKFLYKF